MNDGIRPPLRCCPFLWLVITITTRVNAVASHSLPGTRRYNYTRTADATLVRLDLSLVGREKRWYSYVFKTRTTIQRCLLLCFLRWFSQLGVELHSRLKEEVTRPSVERLHYCDIQQTPSTVGKVVVNSTSVASLSEWFLCPATMFPLYEDSFHGKYEPRIKTQWDECRFRSAFQIQTFWTYTPPRKSTKFCYWNLRQQICGKVSRCGRCG